MPIKFKIKCRIGYSEVEKRNIMYYLQVVVWV